MTTIIGLFGLLTAFGLTVHLGLPRAEPQRVRVRR